MSDHVYMHKRRQALWLPVVHQLMLLMNVPDFRKQIDFECNDTESHFINSQFFQKFQQIKFTKVIDQKCLHHFLYFLIN